MVTQQAQIKVNLPLPLKKLIEEKADRFGLPIAGYIRHLVITDVQADHYPVYAASQHTEKAYEDALAHHDEAVKVTGNIETFLESV